MSRTRTAELLVADVRVRANMENSEFVTDEEILEYINQELAELHGRIILGEGQPHFRSSTSISVVSGTALYSLPTDFFDLQELTASISGYVRTLHPFMPSERAALLNSALYLYTESPQYRIQGTQIEILPSTLTYTATLYYRRNSPRLTLGATPTADTFDGFNGYEVAAIYGATATCLAKEESDPSFYLAQKDKILRHIDALVSRRDASHPERVQDVTGALNYYPWEP